MGLLVLAAGVEVGQHQFHMVCTWHHGRNFVPHAQMQSVRMQEPVFVQAPVHGMQQVHVDGRVVGVVKGFEEGRALGRIQLIEMVDEFLVEDSVDEGGFIGRSGGVGAGDEIDVVGFVAGQVHEDFRRALAGTDDGVAPRAGVPAAACQIVMGMEDPRIGQGRLKGRRHAGGAPQAGDQVAGAPSDPFALCRVRGDFQQGHAARFHHRVDGGHGLAGAGPVAQLVEGPRQVVVELHPAGVEALEVAERAEAPLLVDVVDERVGAARVAGGGQILQEAHLHVGIPDQHLRVPREGALPFEEYRVECVPGALPRMALLEALFQGDGDGHVGRAEADADCVMHGHGFSLSGLACEDMRKGMRPPGQASAHGVSVTTGRICTIFV